MEDRMSRGKLDRKPVPPKVYRVDVRKDLALLKKLRPDAGALYRCRHGRAPVAKIDPEVTLLVEELRRNAGTSRGAALRHEIVKVISAARKEVAGKARAAAFGRR